MNLEGIITWVASDGGAPLLAYYLMEQIAFLRTIANAELKRVVAFALTGFLADAFYCLGIAMQFVAQPEDWRGWVNTLVSVALLAIFVNQLKHGASTLSPRAVRAKNGR